MKKHKSIEDIEVELVKNGPREALVSFCSIIGYPVRVEDITQWGRIFNILSRIANALEIWKLAKFSKEASLKPNDTRVLYNLGYHLIESKLYSSAVTVLARADRLLPGNEQIVTELVHALGCIGDNYEACSCLRSSNLIESSWLCKYLLAFHSIMSANLSEAQQLSYDLASTYNVPGDIKIEDKMTMIGCIEGMLKRADDIKGVMPLNNQDLRGWHFVINGAFLLHISPHGFYEGMNGRYAFIQDSLELCREGIRKLSIVLDTMKLRPPRIFILDDYDSIILGHAVANILNVPIKLWRCNADGTGSPTEPGLIVVYDLFNIKAGTLLSFSEHRPEQILFSHVTRWTEDFPFSADLTTYLCQYNIPPWERYIDPSTMNTQYESLLDDSISALANKIALANSLENEEFLPEDLESLELLAHRTLLLNSANVIQFSSIRNRTPFLMEGEDLPGILRHKGSRRKLWLDSPVKSNSFM